VHDISDLESLGLTLNDYAISDSTKEILLLSQHRTAAEREIKMLSNQNSELQEILQELAAERKRSDKLLHNILPAAIADRMCKGEGSILKFIISLSSFCMQNSDHGQVCRLLYLVCGYCQFYKHVCANATSTTAITTQQHFFHV
jgi:hypothetical protein